MKNKEKFKKIANIISKVLIGILIALLVLCIGVVCFRACSSNKHVAYASETDGIGTWVWNDELPFSNLLYWNSSSDFITYNFTFSSNNRTFVGIDTSSTFGGSYISVYNSSTGWSSVSAYRTIDIKTAPPAEFLTILQANATYQGGGEPDPEPITYTVLKNGSNCLINGPGTVQSGQTYQYTVVADSGYLLPQFIIVAGATLDSYDATTGIFTISNPTGNVFVTAEAVERVVYTVLKSGTNCVINGPGSVYGGQSYQYTIVPDAGFTYPDSVTVTHATLDSYDSKTGTINISDVTSNVTIIAAAPLITNPDGLVRSKFTFLNTLKFEQFTAATQQNVNFTTVNGTVVTEWQTIKILGNSSTGFYLAFQRFPNAGEPFVVWTSADGWISPQYQVVDFGSEYQRVTSDFYLWLLDNTVGQDSFSSESYQTGYNDGLATGQTVGYNAGYSAGQSYGYKTGYEAGLAEGQNSALHGAEGIIAGTASLFDINIFGSFSMLDAFLVIFGIGVCIWFLKMFAGG